MSYQTISVKEALERINRRREGWYLPEVQRQYVWGKRDESEEYICLLLDSLLKGYPIGGIVLWETDQPVPFREFLDDYVPGNFARLVDKSRHGEHKSLVYDGQQRLQTLHSVLGYRFNDRILHYDLQFDRNTKEPDETGFVFRNAGEPPKAHFLSMVELFGKNDDVETKVDLESRMLAAAEGDKELERRVRVNLSGLWDMFVTTRTKPIAYFSVRSRTKQEVEEVFRRLNTGGMALTELELVLGRIKSEQPDYEEKLWDLSKRIGDNSLGIEFSSTDILQFFHLLIKKTIRIDEDRIEKPDLMAFQDVLKNDAEPLVEFFGAYLWGLFRINHASIVPRWSAVLPLIAYLAMRKRSGREWRIRALPDAELRPMHQYFLLSQFCDWNTQTMVNAFARAAMEAATTGLPFPLEDIRDTAVAKYRTGSLSEQQLLAARLFATKVLMPERSYVFQERKPQIDHVFPLNLQGMDDLYRESVDALWNFQPVPADVNNYKRARHPKEFFNSPDGAKYWGSYDFIPAQNDALWDDVSAFIQYRRKRMLDALQERYGITLAHQGQKD